MKRILKFILQHAAPFGLAVVAILMAWAVRAQSTEQPVTEPEPGHEPEVTAVDHFREVTEMIEDKTEEQTEDDQLSAKDITAILEEADHIEAALVEQGYFREDIPLTYLEQDYLHTAADEFGVPYELAVAVIWRETTFRSIVGDDGASVGYMQVQERYHGDRMEALGVTDLSDPYSNFRVGCSYLAEMIERYDGNIEMALMAYNAGPNGANKHWFSKGIYSNQYSQAVLEYMEGITSGND